MKRFALILAAGMAAPAQTPPELQAIDFGGPIVFDGPRFTNVTYAVIGWGVADLASAENGDRTLATVIGVTVSTNVLCQNNGSGCPGYGKLGAVLTSFPMDHSGHNHPPAAPCYPHVLPTERWTVTEVVKSGVVRVFGESFPFSVTVSKTTNSHEVLRQEWRVKQ